MKKALIRLLAIALLLTTSNLVWGQAGKKKPLPAPKKITSLEGITEYRLDNGLTVLLFPDPSKSTITVNITYLVGSRHEGYGESGMAHLLEHMVFKGTPKHPNIPQELTAHGARPNGTTWYDRTNYFETFSATDENLRWALDLESDRMVNSFIAKKDLESEFSVVRNEFESGENDPSGVLMERVLSTAYLWHNYGKSTIGSKEDIELVPIENLQAFYKKFYQPDNAVLTIAGKFDEQKTLALVNEYFGPIPRPARVLQPTYTVEPTQDGERQVILNRVGDIQVVAAGYHIPAGAHPDFPALSVLTDVLINEPSGRLYKALVETKMASSVDGFAFGLHDPGYIYFSAEVLKDKSIEEVKKTMLGLLDNLKNNPITKEETDRAKNKNLKDFEQTYQNSDRVGLTLSNYISKGDWRLWFYYRDQLEKVTADDVNRVVNNYLKPSNRTIGIFIPDATPDRAVIPPTPDLAEMLKNYKGKEALAHAEEFDPSPLSIQSKVINGDIAGGAKYTFLPKSTRGNSVSLSISLRVGSEQSLSGKSTVADFAAGMLKRGSKNLTFQQINDSLDALKASVGISQNDQVIHVSVQSTKENLVPTLNIVYEILREPVFPAAEFDKLKDEELAAIDQQRNEPQTLAFVTFQKILRPYPKTHFLYTMSFDEQADAIKALKIEEVKKFYTDYFNSAHATVAVVGDFDSESVKTELNRILGNWTSTVGYTRVPAQYFNPAAESQKINTPDKANAMLVAGMNLKLSENDPDYPALTIGNYILGGGFLNSRLAVRIRQKEGISYGVGSFIQANPIDESGIFGTYAIYNPDNSDKLVAAYKDELDKMIKNGFTENELKDAVKGYLQSKNVSRSQDKELVGKLNSNLFLGRTMQWDADFENKISALTVAQVSDVMKKWIQPEKISIIQAGDFERKKP
ncbi:MAG: insulinase family protein [Bacteroidia bacterium]|nr:insulinase family protein [Bacteroidia bacterium]MCZ2278397.1 insulinase family protein [Bacteroidia bacterium]